MRLPQRRQLPPRLSTALRRAPFWRTAAPAALNPPPQRYSPPLSPDPPPMAGRVSATAIGPDHRRGPGPPTNQAPCRSGQKTVGAGPPLAATPFAATPCCQSTAATAQSQTTATAADPPAATIGNPYLFTSSTGSINLSFDLLVLPY